jgi:hypothetical protein
MATSLDSTLQITASSDVTTTQKSVAMNMSSFARHIRRQDAGESTIKVDQPAYADTLTFTAVNDSDVYYMSEELSLSDLLIKPVVTTTSTIDLFGRHNLSQKHIGPVIRSQHSPDWLFPVVLLLIGSFAWLRVFYNRYLGQMLYALVNVNLANQIVRDENILLQRATVYLNVLFYLVGALFLYELSFQLSWELSALGVGFTRFLFFVLLISAVYAGKFLVVKFCGWLFDIDRELSTYLFNIFIINNLLGMVIFPFTIIMAFNPGVDGSWIFTVCLIVIGVLYLFRLFRGLQIGLNTPGVSLLYLFLYLCSLELAPLLVLFRITGTN